MDEQQLNKMSKRKHLFIVGGCIFIALIVFSFILFSQDYLNIHKPYDLEYIQDQNKQDLADISDNTADIMSGAITKTVQAVKSGLDDTMFCKHCGAQIDADSAFCNKCGKKL